MWCFNVTANYNRVQFSLHWKSQTLYLALFSAFKLGVVYIQGITRNPNKSDYCLCTLSELRREAGIHTNCNKFEIPVNRHAAIMNDGQLMKECLSNA